MPAHRALHAGPVGRHATMWRDGDGGNGSSATVAEAAKAARDNRPRRGKQASLYLGFGDTAPGGEDGAQRYTTNDTSL